MSLTLLDWRRRVFALYAQVRAAPDPATAHAHWVQTRRELFDSHPDSPGKPFRVTAYDPAYRFLAEVDTDVEQLPMEVPTATDGIVPFERVGRVHLDELGSLDVWALRSYGGGIFVPMRDATAGRTTYGGGRYILDTVKGADLGGDVDLDSGRGTLVVDLNFAYAPSCAYDERWACPLAPEGNRLTVAVEVGELSAR
jgi:uncharacterized protein (DUF1684 family)